jgi:hypothetical protein
MGFGRVCTQTLLHLSMRAGKHPNQKRGIPMADINPKIIIIAEGSGVDGAAIEKVLGGLPDVKVRSQGAQRGIGLVGILKWTVEFFGNSGKLAEGLGKAAENLTAGASLKVQVGLTIVEINNANRGEIPALLDKAVQAAQAASKL